jgi:diguanylate cyclase
MAATARCSYWLVKVASAVHATQFLRVSVILPLEVVLGELRMTTDRIFGISSKGWRTLATWTLTGTIGCILFAVTFNYFAFRNFDSAVLSRGIIVAVILPILLAGPLFFYLTLKMRELARLNYQLNQLATKDFGTGLLNRRALIMRVDEETAKMAFNPAITHLFLVVDADRFKSINDQYGHAAGDEALKLISAALEKSIRSYDVVGRIGGEEFAVFLPNVPEKDATYIADRLRRAVASSEFRPNGLRYDLSVSVGGVVYQNATAFTELFKAADANLYAAKEQGRNCSIITALDDCHPARKTEQHENQSAQTGSERRRSTFNQPLAAA